MPHIYLEPEELETVRKALDFRKDSLIYMQSSLTRQEKVDEMWKIDAARLALDRPVAVPAPMAGQAQQEAGQPQLSPETIHVLQLALNVMKRVVTEDRRPDPDDWPTQIEHAYTELDKYAQEQRQRPAGAEGVE